MKRFVTIVCLLVATGWAALMAQEAPAGDEPATALPTVESLETGLKEIEANADLDELAKQSLSKRYTEAIGALKEASQFREWAKDYSQALEQGPAEAERVRSEITALQAVEPDDLLPEGIGEKSTTQELEAALSLEEAALATLQSERSRLDQALATLEQRTGILGERSLAAQRELEAATRELEAIAGENSSPAESAERLRLQARQEQLAAEVAMLEAEERSRQIRASTQKAAQELVEAKIAAVQQRVAALRELASTSLVDQLGQAEALVAEVREAFPQPPAPVASLLQDLTGLIEKTRTVSRSIGAAEGTQVRRAAELERIEEAFKDMRQQFDLGGRHDPLTQGLFELLRNLPSKRDSKQRLAQSDAEVAEARSALFQLERASRHAAQMEKDENTATPPSDDVDAPAWQSEAEALKEGRANLQAELEAAYRRWIQVAVAWNRTERAIALTRTALQDFAKEKLFLVRTSPVLGTSTIHAVPAGLDYCYGLNRWGELASRLASMPVANWLVPALLIGLLLLLRPLFGRWLQETGNQTRRTSTDRYTHTVAAILVTLLLAAPPALAAFSLGLALVQQAEASQWSFGLGSALVGASAFLFKTSFLIVLCRKKGLGAVHFQWDGAMLRRVRRLTYWWILAFLPTEMTIDLVFSEPGVTHLNGLGRVAGLVMALGLGSVIALMMHPERGIAAAAFKSSPHSIFGRLRKLWFVLPLVTMLFIEGLLIAGYVFAGITLMEEIARSLIAVMAAFIVYGLILRWISIRERKLALKERLKARRARQEARHDIKAEKPSPKGGADEARIPEVQEEEEMDLAEVGEQTRKLLGFVVAVGLLWILFIIWSDLDPVVNVLDNFAVSGKFSLADGVIVLLVLAGIVATTRNLPGLLEVLALRRLGLDAGTRNAITTLSKYAVIGVGAAFLFDRLGIDWSQFGWIAAALGVGLGFGLQEVVANFVCGIILLFERPVRVGDIVTVDGIDGVVSRIEMRATTITNWDRKEFIVPNKQFITGTLLNWTLSSPVNRIVIVVGAAYGCDTDKARRILLEVAREHARIIDDPAPMATFEEFSDSSLKLVLRCFLPDMDNRLTTISELHTEIARRFHESGIEIPFPQRDLHLRSGGDEIRKAIGERRQSRQLERSTS